MFEIQPTRPSDRLRALTLAAAAAWLGVQAYFTAIPLLPAVPRWLFESARALPLLGALAGLVGAGLVLWRGRSQLGASEALWSALLALAVLACAWTWAGMTFAWRL